MTDDIRIARQFESMTVADAVLCDGLDREPTTDDTTTTLDEF